MIQITSNPHDNILYTVASGKLTADDYNKFIPVAKEKVAQFGNFRWYFEMAEFDGWTGEALLKDLKFDVQHVKDMERVAVVGEKKLHDLMTQLIKPFTAGEVKYFDMAQKEQAKAWIKG